MRIFRSDANRQSEAHHLLRLAEHHLVDDHLSSSREWSRHHLAAAATLLRDGPTHALPDALQLMEDSSRIPTSTEIRTAIVAANDQLLANRTDVIARLRRAVPRATRDLGIFIATCCILGGAYARYNGYPLYLWSKDRLVMDVVVESSTQGYGKLQYNKTVEKVPVMIDGAYYPGALGTHAESRIEIRLDKKGKTFDGACGYPDSVRGASITCIVESEGRELVRSGELTDTARLFRFSIPGPLAERYSLRVLSNKKEIAAAHAVWVDLRVTD